MIHLTKTISVSLKLLQTAFYRWEAFLSLLLGVIGFFLVTGGKILSPTYISWLFEGDSTTHWLGWQYFRYSPLLQWPIGANPGYGMAIGSSIVFTDAVSLMAIFLKPFNEFLPDNFQYSGFWILLCFTLQSYFAWKLLSLFTKNKWLPFIGSVFFIIAPAALWRLQYHYALFAHWLLLAALYLYFNQKISTVRWVVLLATAVLIEPYLAAMVIAICIADLTQRRLLKQAGNAKSIQVLLVISLPTVFTMWAAGYFMLGDSVGASGFGYLRTNILSIIDPDNMWSRTLRDQKGGGGDYEGFGYLGLGVILLAIVAFYESVKNFKLNLIPKLRPILFVSFILFLFSISNHVGVGEYELFTYQVPSIFEKFTTSFRTSGRFFWPVYYLIYLSIFYVIFTKLKHCVAMALCVTMLFLQVVDSVDAWRYFREKFNNAPEWVSPMQSSVWSEFTKKYKKVYWVNLPRNSKVGWFPICHYAALNKMDVNVGHFGRTSPKRITESAELLENSIVNHNLDSNALYIFEDEAMWNIASNQASIYDTVGLLDGYKILAPNYKSCGDCDKLGIDKISIADSNRINYQMERIYFTINGTGKKHQLYGWQDPEEWGTWSVGKTALLLLSLNHTPESDINLLIDGAVYLGKMMRSQEVDVHVNNQLVATLKYDQRSNLNRRIVKIPKSLVHEKAGQLLIKFNFKNPVSPLDVGESGDSRKRGLGIVSLKLESVK
jgi:hypothetical protein